MTTYHLNLYPKFKFTSIILLFISMKVFKFKKIIIQQYIQHQQLLYTNLLHTENSIKNDVIHFIDSHLIIKQKKLNNHHAVMVVIKVIGH